MSEQAKAEAEAEARARVEAERIAEATRQSLAANELSQQAIKAAAAQASSPVRAEAQGAPSSAPAAAMAIEPSFNQLNQARAILLDFKTRFGHMTEFADVTRAIIRNSYCKESKAA